MKTGRPPRAAKASTEQVTVRLTTGEMRHWSMQARRARLPVAVWVRERCAAPLESRVRVDESTNRKFSEWADPRSRGKSGRRRRARRKQRRRERQGAP